MGKRTDELPGDAAEAFGVGKLTRHLFICIGPDCVDPDKGDKTWNYLKKRLKELNLTGADGPFYRTKCQCLRICTAGPICVVYPEGTWYPGTSRPRTPSASCRSTSSAGGSFAICFAENPLD